jgi:hypothetical protein
MVNRRLALVIVIIFPILAAVTIQFWLQPLLVFMGANSDVLQGFESTIQLIIWIGGSILVIFSYFGFRRQIDQFFEKVHSISHFGVQAPGSYIGKGGFESGSRIRITREELGLKTSKLAEYLEIPSQREYEAMESGMIETPLPVLEKLHVLSGVSLEWLKHNEGPRYRVHQGDFRFGKNITRDGLFRLRQRGIILTIDTDTLVVLIIVKFGEYQYPVIDYGISLEFWNWIDHLGTIPIIYRFLTTLCDEQLSLEGVILPRQIQDKLGNGQIHFLSASQKAHRGGHSLPYALIDISYSDNSKEYYSSRYGRWILRVHEYFRDGSNTSPTHR